MLSSSTIINECLQGHDKTSNEPKERLPYHARTTRTPIGRTQHPAFLTASTECSIFATLLQMRNSGFPRKNRSWKTVERPYFLGLSAETFPTKKLLGVVLAHLTQPYQPSPITLSGRPAHRPFRSAPVKRLASPRSRIRLSSAVSRRQATVSASLGLSGSDAAPSFARPLATQRQSLRSLAPR